MIPAAVTLILLSGSIIKQGQVGVGTRFGK